MWSYYGSKSKIVNLYPAPKYDTIIEPFAGSARYSLKWFYKNIILIEKNQIIVDLWKWLQKCSPKDILSLPNLKFGDKLSNFNLTREEKIFLGFCINDGSSSPKQQMTARSSTGNKFQFKILDTAKMLFKIKHWEIQQGDYTNAQNKIATWFIDPPYQQGGEPYKYSNRDLDYSFLANWCKDRKGQCLVCDNATANWLPFTPIKIVHGGKYFSMEGLYQQYN
jgi:hypothetical protein